MNIRPQEITLNGERSVRYKGSDGKMHDVLPQDAAIPVKQNTVIAAGSEITLAQAHAIEGFDFNKCSAISFNSGFSIYAEISVNRNDDGSHYLYLNYPGHVALYTKKNGSEYDTFQNTDGATEYSFTNSQYPYDEEKAVIAEIMLAIAKQTGKLIIYHKGQTNELVPGYYEESIILTLAEDLVVDEEFFIGKSSGELVKIGLPKDAAVPVVHRSIIEAGSEITLAQAHALESFDFNNCTSIRFNQEFSTYSSFLVNPESSDNVDSARYLEYSYPGQPRIRYHKNGDYYPFFTSSEAPSIQNFSNDEQGAKEMLEQVLLEIAKQTGKLEIFSVQGPDSAKFLQSVYETAILLTVKNDILLTEEFFLESFNGDLLKLATVSEEDESVEESHPYSLQNNPNAYEIIDSGTTIYNGNPKYVAKACDGSETTIDSNTLYEILLNDPNTTIIFKDEKPGVTGAISTAILRITEIYERLKYISLTGKITGNTTHTDYYVTVRGNSNENWITLSKTTS